MQIGNSNHNYFWHEKWVEAPGADSVKDGWAHHGIVVSPKTGNVITFILSWIAKIKKCIFNHYRFSTKEKERNEVFMFLVFILTYFLSC